ncbi:alanine racemase [Bacillus horti]|uniref:D-serine deaminase-like pyridoxal phosphate-dependent protein n=1 Tax=Caldalkalibacillus horti TaxID=77523 RepID=A0ABT9VU42_9BACI|nr:alanine racemase [Bacillus horti]MDQ0164506.1 D-serine deaminase-like pyridoxal phosphate-dependent protein [Bacillus horti]
MHPYLNNWLTSNDAGKILTPQVLVNQDQLKQNIKDMASFSKEHVVKLRPHFKTHKTMEILQLQLEQGAIGVTVAKLGEAEEIVASSLFNGRKLSILVAYPVVGEQNLQRALALQKQAELILMVDHMDQVIALNAFAKQHQTSFSVTVKINTGLNRCGLNPDSSEVRAFIRNLLNCKNLSFIGVMTHAGHAYGASSTEELNRIGHYEAGALLELIDEVSSSFALPQLEVSVGSTPTARISGAVPGVTELRPGNYVFYDRTQVGLGVATFEQCALRVASRVVSQPAPNRWIIDAGSKTLTLDQGAHGQSGVSGYGYVVGQPDLTITRLSEEHGVLEGSPNGDLRIGDIIEVIPNHACPVVNLADELVVLSLNQEEFTIWEVKGRGKSR